MIKRLRNKKPTVLKTNAKNVLHWVEILLGSIVIIAVLVATAYQVIELANADWTNMETFTHMLRVILQLAIGVEVARLLFSYCLDTIIELAVFLVARKLLLLESDFWALILGVSSLAILFAIKHFFTDDEKIATNSKKISEV